MSISISSILAISAIILSFISILIVLVLYITNKKNNKYDDIKKRAYIEYLRDSYEKNIYENEERLMSNKERWIDTNHLILGSQKMQSNKYYNDIKINDFLRSAGISENDLIIDNKMVFVLTPFNNKYGSVYDEILKICNSIGLQCSRGDEVNFKQDFFPYIIKQILKAKCIIANVDGRSPNVFYELGFAHALDKKSIIISKTIDDLPADIKSKRTIVYKNMEDLDKKLKEEIIKIYLDK